MKMQEKFVLQIVPQLVTYKIILST